MEYQDIQDLLLVLSVRVHQDNHLYLDNQWVLSGLEARLYQGNLRWKRYVVVHS